MLCNVNQILWIKILISWWYYLSCWNSGADLSVSRCEVPPSPLLPGACCQNMRWKHMSSLWSVKMSVCAPPKIFVSNGWLFTKYPSLNISINLHEFDTQKPTIQAVLPVCWYNREVWEVLRKLILSWYYRYYNSGSGSDMWSWQRADTWKLITAAIRPHLHQDTPIIALTPRIFWVMWIISTGYIVCLQ